jgi:NitT/TauT family transport system permease protein
MARAETAAMTSGPRRAVRRPRSYTKLRRLIVPIGLLIVWQLAAMTNVLDQNAVPAPSTVVESWLTWIFGERSALAWYSGTWFEYTLLSARRVLIGFALAGVVGVGLGLLIGWSRLMRDLADPLIQILRPIPIVAWLPFATLLFGIQDTAAVFLIALGSFFPIVLNTAAAAERTPAVLVRAALMLGTPRRRLLQRVVLPSSLPGIMTGLRLGMGLAWVLVIVAEMLAVKGGLGYALWSGYQFIRMDLIVAAMASLALLGYAFDLLLVAISRWLLRWSPTI